MLETLKAYFDTFDSSDIFSTWKLREIASSCAPGKYDNIVVPMKYHEEEFEPDITIEEILEDSDGHVEPGVSGRCETEV